MRRVLVAGCGRLGAAIVASVVGDRLFLTTAPLVVGDGVPGLRVSGTDRLADAMRPPVRRWMLGDDVVTEFDLATSRSVDQAAAGVVRVPDEPARSIPAGRAGSLASLRPIAADDLEAVDERGETA